MVVEDGPSGIGSEHGDVDEWENGNVPESYAGYAFDHKHLHRWDWVADSTGHRKVRYAKWSINTGGNRCLF